MTSRQINTPFDFSFFSFLNYICIHIYTTWKCICRGSFIWERHCCFVFHHNIHFVSLCHRNSFSFRQYLCWYDFIFIYESHIHIRKPRIITNKCNHIPYMVGNVNVEKKFLSFSLQSSFCIYQYNIFVFVGSGRWKSEVHKLKKIEFIVSYV